MIGSVSAAELLVTVSASAGFLVGLDGEGVELPLVLALLAGGVVAAPLAAWLVRHADSSVLGVVVGTLLLVTNARTLLLELGTPGPIRLPVLVGIAAAGLAIARHVHRIHRVDRTRAPVEATGKDEGAALVPEPPDVVVET